MSWFDAGHRDLPWRRTADPYAIWISEVMLQQTRAAAAIPYYLRFLERFPTVASLARAEEWEVLSAWSGLGYYGRARNLWKAARAIASVGEFPAEHAAIRALPGVGAYTAAAVASIAFGLPHAVLDGNVLRVIARMTADPSNIGEGPTRKRFQTAADSWLDRARPGAFNQAMMELGATVCLPRNPRCLLCPVELFCKAGATGTQSQYPVKTVRVKASVALSELGLIERGGELLLRQRPGDAARMPGFWELPENSGFEARARRQELGSFVHTIVNTRWTVRVFRIELEGNGLLPDGVQWRRRTDLGAFPVTTITRKALALADRNLQLVDASRGNRGQRVG